MSVRTRQFDNVLRVRGREIVAEATNTAARSYVIAPSRLTPGTVIAHRPCHWGNIAFPSVEAAEDYCRADAGSRELHIRREGGL